MRNLDTLFNETAPPTLTTWLIGLALFIALLFVEVWVLEAYIF